MNRRVHLVEEFMRDAVVVQFRRTTTDAEWVGYVAKPTLHGDDVPTLEAVLIRPLDERTVMAESEDLDTLAAAGPDPELAPPRPAPESPTDALALVGELAALIGTPNEAGSVFVAHAQIRDALARHLIAHGVVTRAQAEQGEAEAVRAALGRVESAIRVNLGHLMAKDPHYTPRTDGIEDALEAALNAVAAERGSEQ